MRKLVRWGGVARYSEDANDAYLTLTREMEGKLDDDKTYEFIIEIYDTETPVYRQSDEMTVQTFSRAVREGREESLVEKRINDQNGVLADIFGERNIRKVSDEISYSAMSKSSSFKARNNSRPILRNANQLKTMPRYKALLNGFALRMTYAEAKEVAKLPNVKAVTKAVEYKLPQDEKPSMVSSKRIIHADVSTQRGFDGKGRVVAILDTGADVDHPDFRLSDEGKAAAKYSEAKINEKIKDLHLWGKYRTDKIPYAYNYADRCFELLDNADHGQHIAGTIAGNAANPDEGVVGVVPEAQLLVMRVFALGVPTTNTAIYAEAIDDAVLLEADSINMSLGSYAGSEDTDKILTKVVQNANEHGTVVCMAGGNDGYQFSYRKSQPYDFLDFEAIAAPSAMKESLAVASFNNSHITFKRGLFKIDEEEISAMAAEYTNIKPEWNLDSNTEYDLVFVGQGNSDDYDDLDVTNKIVVAERGGASFGEKSAIARKEGAKACIIGWKIRYREKYDKLYRIQVENNQQIVPTYGISNKTYDEIKKKQVNKIKFVKNDMSGYESPVKDTMSDFSSWGPTPGLGIKPEITVPGGDIWSTANNGGYQFLSGTSMATPHVAAGIAAVRGKLNQLDNLGIDKKELAMFVKKVLMNTAKPAKTKFDNYYSVRNQGAGIMDLDDATSGNYLTIEDAREGASSFGEAKVELKQVTEAKINVNLKLKSYLDKDVKYNVSYVLQTDRIEDGSLILEPDVYNPVTLGTGNLNSVTISKGGEANLSQEITWDDSQLIDDYKNGYFVDGYIFFKPEDDTLPTLSIPMLAFKGEWDSMPVFEKLIHEYDLSSGSKEKPFWIARSTERRIYKQTVDKLDVSMLLTQVVNIDNNEVEDSALGRALDGKFTRNLAISPGIKDRSQDSFQYKGVFLRNWDDFYIEILDKDGKQIRKIESPYNKSGRKAGLTVNGSRFFSFTDELWTWDGTDAAGNQVAEGEYTVKVHAKAQNNPTAAAHEYIATVIVDNTKPLIEEAPSFDENDCLTVKSSDELSGIKAVYYVYKNDYDDYDYEVVTEADNGSYYLEYCEKKNGIVHVVDWAGNITKLDLGENGKNVINISRNTEEYNFVEIAAYDEKHNKITNLNAVNDGTYTMEALNLPEGVSVEINPTEITFGEGGVTSPVTVNVKFSKIPEEELDKYGELKVTVADSKVLEDFFTVFVVDKNGKKYQLYTVFDSEDEVYGSKIPEGDYTILVEDINGKKVDFVGEKQIYVKKQDVSWAKIRFARKGLLKLNISTENQEIYNKIAGEIISSGEFNNNSYNVDIKKYFRLIDSKTGFDLLKDMEEYMGTCKLLPAKDGNPIYNIEFYIPADGDYTAEFINDDREYTVKDIRVDAELDSWASITLLYPSQEKAKLTVIEEFVSEKTSNEIIKAKYTLSDEYGKVIDATDDKNWNDLQAKIYTLEVESLNEKLVPEKKVFTIDLTSDKDFKQVVRWKDISADSVKRYTSLAIGAYGEYNEESKNIQVLLKNKYTKEEILIKVEAGTKYLDEVVPLGSYDVTLILPDDIIIDEIFIYVDENPDTKEKLYALDSKFDVTFVSSFNEIEIKLKKQKRDFGEVDVVANGLQGESVSYKLSRNGEEFEAADGIFKNLEPGKYTLTFDVPEGYEVDSNQIEVTVEEGKVNTVYVNFNKNLDDTVATHKATIQATEVNDKGQSLRDLDLKFVAIAEDGSQYSIDKIPEDTKVKLVEVGLPDGFERKDASEEYITFTEDTNFDFEYVNKKVLPANENDSKEGYVNITFDAADNGVLNAPGFNNVKKLSYLVKEAYQVSDFEFYIPEVIADKDYEFKNWDKQLPSKRFAKSETLVAQYEYHEPIVPPTPDPDPTPDPGNEPYEPSWPDEPYRPERPYRPHRPNVNKTEEKKEEPSIVTPKEEKKDYGIVDTEELLPVTLNDIPNTAAGTAIRSLVSRGILAGMGNDKFLGELPITRAMVSAVLMRISVDKNINTQTKFTDVKAGDWFNEAVMWAAGNGLFVGYLDGSFKPNKLVSRQELALILQKFLALHGINMDEVKTWTYTDLDKVPAWSKDAVIAMAKIALVNGQTDTMYNPESEFIREELAVMLYNIIRWVETH